MNKNEKPTVSKNTVKTAKRLLQYVTRGYKVPFVVVLICILISSIATISVSLSLRFLLDDYIIPLIGQTDPNFAELYTALAVLASIFLLGVISTFIYSRMMVVIGQGVLKKVRDEMFEHMQTLPIRYFDQNTNGSIMSLYTNDTDTLRQMINQSIPQISNVSLHHHRDVYRDAGFKSDFDDPRRFDDPFDGVRLEKNRRKQRKIFHPPAD